MRNLVCLARSRMRITGEEEHGEARSSVSAIAPIPSSDNSFYVAKGPSPQIREIEIFHVGVRPFQYTLTR
jgi:hypothetical protein